MDQEILEQIKRMEQKIDAIQTSVEKIRRHFLWSAIITIAMFVIPLIGVLLFLPKMMGGLESQITELGITL